MTAACTISELSSHIGRPDCPAVLDVTTDEDLAKDPFLIPGARCHRAQQVSALSELLRGEDVVVVCQKGLKLSQGAAAVLRADGLRARHLEGGNVAWRDSGAPRLALDAVPPPDTLWVAGPGDRVASWMVRRFVQKDAKILSVSEDVVASVADKFEAIPVASVRDAITAPRLDELASVLAETGPFSPSALVRAAHAPDAVLDAAYAALTQRAAA